MLMASVFNENDKLYLGTITKMAQEALNNGFRFFLFNDIVYLVVQNENYYDTGLIKGDLAIKM